MNDNYRIRACPNKKDPVTFDAPNQYARPAKIELHSNMAVFHGYQEFILTPSTVHVLPDDLSLQKKYQLLTPYFQPHYLEKRTVLDLGANAGFFCYWAMQEGATETVALDMDENYLHIMREAITKLGLKDIRIEKANVADWTEPSDIVLTLALIHWIYSCTAFLGSLDSVVEKLAQLTNYMLIVEWVEPGDPAIQFFHHIDWNKELIRGPYTLEAFEGALGRFFARYELIGEISPTRKLYVAFRTENETDFSGPLPLIRPKESIIYRKCLAKDQGYEYWSCIYDGGDVLYKQTTLDLAEREAYFLSLLESDYFPRVIDVKSEGSYSVITLEKIQGLPLIEAIASINSSLTTLHNFIQDCLNLLSELKQQGIIHRDIRSDNILIRGKKPVLIDFGWAISDTKAYLTPKDLNCFARPPDDSFCDVYSMGKVFEQVNQHQHSVFDPVIKLMTNSNPSLRTTELETLKLLFSSAIDRWLAVNSGSNINDMSDEQSFNNHRMRRVIGQLVEQISKRDQRISWLEIEHERLVQRLAETEWRAQSLSAQVNTLAQEMTIMYTLKWWKAKLCGAIFEGLLVFGRKTLPLRVRCWLHARLVKILRMVS